MNVKNRDNKKILGHSQRKGNASKWFVLIMIFLAMAYVVVYTGGFGLMPRAIRAVRETVRTKAAQANRNALASAMKAYESSYNDTATMKATEFVRQRLLDAARGEDLNEIISSLYQEHAQAIKENWKQIRVAPENLVREDREAVNYAVAVMALATYFKERGDASLLKEPESNSGTMP